MKLKHMNLLAVVGVVVSVATVANAGAIQLTVAYFASYTPTFSPLGVLDLENPSNNILPDDVDFKDVQHQFDISVGVSDLEPSEDLAGISFDFDLDPGLMPGFGWLGNDEKFALGAPFPNTKYYEVNIDAGDPTDLKTIQVGILRNVAADRQIGEQNRTSDDLGTPSFLGNVFVTWNPEDGNPAVLRITPSVVAPWSLYGTAGDTGAGENQSREDFEGGEFVFGIIPEPASAVMLAIGSMAMLSRRRRA